MLVSLDVLIFIILWMAGFFFAGAFAGRALKRSRKPERLRPTDIARFNALMALLPALGERMVKNPPPQGADTLIFKADAEHAGILARNGGYDETLIAMIGLMKELPDPDELQRSLNLAPEPAGPGGPVRLGGNFLDLVRLHGHACVHRLAYAPYGSLASAPPFETDIPGVPGGMGHVEPHPAGFLGSLIEQIRKPGSAKAALRGAMTKLANDIIQAGKPVRGNASGCDFWRVDPERTQRFLVRYPSKLAADGQSGFAIIDYGSDGNTITLHHADKAGAVSGAL